MRDKVEIDGEALLEFLNKLGALLDPLLKLDLDVPTMAALLDVRDAALALAETLED